MAVYITGDIHGSVDGLFFRFLLRYNLRKSDTIIVLGDVGLNYCGDERDRKRKEELLRIFPCNFFFIHGNHEERPENISTYCKRKFWKNWCCVEPEYPRLHFAIDGNRYEVGGKSILVLGGAYSVDKPYRLKAGAKWFPDEQMAPEIRKKIKQESQKSPKIDIVLSHTCPLSWQPKDLFIDIDQSMVDNSMEKWLDEMENILEYDKWFFGHYHANRKMLDGKVVMLYNDVEKL